MYGFIVIHIHLVGKHQSENTKYKYKICFFLHSNRVGYQQNTNTEYKKVITKHKQQNTKYKICFFFHSNMVGQHHPRPSPHCSLTMDSLRRSPRHHLTPSSMVDTFVLSMSATTTYNHLKPHTTTYNQPQPPTTNHMRVDNKYLMYPSARPALGPIPSSTTVCSLFHLWKE